MTRMTRPDCAVMCNLINTHTHTHTHTIKESEECAWKLYVASNQSSRALSTHTMGRSSCKISKPKKCGDEESYGKV